MAQLITHIGRTARRLTLLAIPLLVATTGTADAMGGGYGGGKMGPRMGSGPGMMTDRSGAWGGGLPFVGGALGMLGLVGGLLYWALT